MPSSSVPIPDMYVRFRGPQRGRTYVSLVKDGFPRAATLGSIRDPQSQAERHAFWNRLHHLRFSFAAVFYRRVDSRTWERIYRVIASRIPR